MGHLSKTQTEIAVMLTLPVFESYTKIKTLLKDQEALLHWYLLKDVLKYAAKLLENTMQIQSSFVV